MHMKFVGKKEREKHWDVKNRGRRVALKVISNGPTHRLAEVVAEEN